MISSDDICVGFVRRSIRFESQNLARWFRDRCVCLNNHHYPTGRQHVCKCCYQRQCISSLGPADTKILRDIVEQLDDESDLDEALQTPRSTCSTRASSPGSGAKTLPTSTKNEDPKLNQNAPDRRRWARGASMQ